MPKVVSKTGPLHHVAQVRRLGDVARPLALASEGWDWAAPLAKYATNRANCSFIPTAVNYTTHGTKEWKTATV